MSDLERLSAACLLPSFSGQSAPEWALRWVERGLGGFVLFADNVRDPEQLRGLTAQLRAAGDVLLAVDEEGGDVTRLEADRGSSYPGNLALGVVDDLGLTADVAASIAADLARVGANLNLAPVADVNVDPDNPVIGVRSFGADPELVARHVAAFVEGTQRQGVAACAKHFPGHGDTKTDSHVALPVVTADLDAALLPFRAAIATGVKAVMTAHLLVPALDDVPATLSRRVLTELLRDELGFGGLVITDALEMRALAGDVGVEEAAVRALAAGADALCLGHDLREPAVESVVGAIGAAVEDGRLPLGRLEEAARRVRALTRWVNPTADGAPDRQVGLDAARRALAVHGTADAGRDPLVIELLPQANVAAGDRVHWLADALAGATGIRLTTATDARVLQSQANGRRIVFVVRDAARHAWQRALVQSLPGAIVVETGVPNGGGATIDTYGAGRANLQAAAEVLGGG